MKRTRLSKTTVACLAASIALFPVLSWSGWVDDWVQQKSSTSPSYYEGSKRGYYIAITRRLKESGEILGIKVLDHIIIGDDEFLSFVERGLL